ncbi:hypothetical protein ASD04_10810 [Devosia sp. Root436]|uniref:Zn-ribbon domain-containing OB-fold protein n=1 Tax=Devosia sp. Root436 TaxID=1736537 RepID=UPI0007003D48|nr:OB-fold domain-containing protein [Devosia sp. Root436]KQX38111.1 hypothetical protein ASD04_10810 [Devosia sp. Root436]
MADMPQPAIDPWNKPFWDACEQEKLVVQRCGETGRAWFPPSPVSPYAPAAEWDWMECSGEGEVLSWVVFHQKYFAGFTDRLPYNCALIKLKEGPLLVSNIDGPNDSISIGQQVRVLFERRGDVKVPIFRAKDRS